MSPATATEALLALAVAAEAIAASPLVKAVTLSKNPLAYWRLSDLANVAADSSGNGHDAAIQGYADLVKAKGANLVGYWRLEETQGAVAVDSSGGGHNGAIAGGVTLNQPGPLLDPDLAMAFDGATANVLVPDSAAFAFGPANDFTVECWVRTTQTPATQISIVEKWSTGTGYPFTLRLQNGTGKAIFARYDGTNNPTVAGAVINDGRWHHVVGTKLGGVLTCYVDGVAVTGSDTTTASTTNTSPIGIGSRGNSTFFLAGSIDEVAIYNVALSAAEVLQHYNAGVVTRMVTRAIGSLIPGDPNDAAMAFVNVTAATVQANAIGFGAGGAASMAAWFVAPTLPTQMALMGTGQDNNTLAVFLNSNGSIDYRSTGAGIISDLVTAAAGLVVAGQLCHLVAASDGVTKTIYLNGAPVASRAGDHWGVVDGNFTIAGRKPGFSLNFGGTIDEVSIYNAMLSAADVADLYNVGQRAIGAIATASELEL